MMAAILILSAVLFAGALAIICKGAKVSEKEDRIYYKNYYSSKKPQDHEN